MLVCYVSPLACSLLTWKHLLSCPFFGSSVYRAASNWCEIDVDSNTCDNSFIFPLCVCCRSQTVKMSSQQFSRHGLPAPTGGAAQIPAGGNLVPVNQPSNQQGIVIKLVESQHMSDVVRIRWLLKLCTKHVPPSSHVFFFSVSWCRFGQQSWCWPWTAGSSS